MAFEDEIIKAHLKPVITFTYGGNDLSQYVKSYGAITHDLESIVVGGTTVELINDGSLTDEFKNPNWWRKKGVITLTVNGQSQTIFTGYGYEPKFKEGVISLPLKNRFARLMEVEIGSDKAPVQLSGNPADVLWTLLTTYAGLDNTQSSANMDIKYSTWTTYKSDCAAAGLSIGTYVDSPADIRSLVKKVQDNTGSFIFVNREDKLEFRKHVPEASPVSDYSFNGDNLKSLKLQIASDNLTNKIEIYYNYKKDEEEGDTWEGPVVQKDATSQGNYGVSNKVQDEKIVFHKTQTSANHLARYLIDIYKNPRQEIELETFLMGVLCSPGDIIDVTDNYYDYSGKQFRVLKTTERLDRGSVIIKARDLEIEPAWYWSYTYYPSRIPQLEDPHWAQDKRDTTNIWKGSEHYKYNDVGAPPRDAVLWAYNPGQTEDYTSYIDVTGKSTIDYDYTGMGLWAHAAGDEGLFIIEYNASKSQIASHQLTDFIFPNSWGDPGTFDFQLDPDNYEGPINLNSNTKYIRFKIRTEAVGMMVYDANLKFDGGLEIARISGAALLLKSPCTYKYTDGFGTNAEGNTAEILLKADVFTGSPFTFRINDGTKYTEVTLTSDVTTDTAYRLTLKGDEAYLYINGSKQSNPVNTAGTGGTDTTPKVFMGWEDATTVAHKGTATIKYVKIRKGAAFEGTDETEYDPFPSPEDPPPFVENLNVTEIVQYSTDSTPIIQAKIEFDEPSDYIFGLTFLIYHRVGSGLWSMVQEISNTECTIEVVMGANSIRVVSKNASGVSSSFELSPIVTKLFEGKTTKPSNVEFIDANCSFDTQVRVEWAPIQEPGLSFYELRTDTNWGNETNRVYIGLNTSYVLPDPGSTSYTFYIKARDIFGNYSETADSVTVSISTISNITFIDSQCAFEYNIRVEWNPASSGVPDFYELRSENANWGNPTNMIYQGKSTSYVLPDPTEGVYTFYIKACDILGNYSTTADSITLEGTKSIARKYYGSLTEEFRGVVEDNDYIYVVGYSQQEDCIIIKFNKADLSININKKYYGTGIGHFFAITQDTNYIYAVGETQSEGQGIYDALIIKFNKSDLSISARKIYGGSDYDRFRGVTQDTNYVYAVGKTQSEGVGGTEALIIKFNKSDLSINTKKTYGGASSDTFYDAIIDGNYVYAAGITYSEGQGNGDALIVKFNTSDLSISARKVYGGDKTDRIEAIVAGDDFLYCAGRISSGINTYQAGLIAKIQKSDLSLKIVKALEGFTFCLFYAADIDSEYLYFVGHIYPETQETNYDAIILKLNKALFTGGYISDPNYIALSDVVLEVADSTLTLANSGLTLANSGLTLANSSQTLANGILTLSDIYRIL